jgi:hypothetical protein
MIILWGRYFFNKKIDNQNLYINISTEQNQIELHKIINVMNLYFTKYILKRYDEQKHFTEISFIADIEKSSNIERFVNDLKQIYPNISITFLDSRI